jgi:5-methylcytosine-specific restriction endonuclease McrA
MVKRKVSEALKKLVAGRQRYTCATIPNYTCPLRGRPFDESGYDIDHIKELRHGGTNDASNLQALCPSCHRVKTSRNTAKEPTENPQPQNNMKQVVKNIFKNVLFSGRVLMNKTQDPTN